MTQPYAGFGRKSQRSPRSNHLVQRAATAALLCFTAHVLCSVVMLPFPQMPTVPTGNALLQAVVEYNKVLQIARYSDSLSSRLTRTRTTAMSPEREKSSAGKMNK